MALSFGLLLALSQSSAAEVTMAIVEEDFPEWFLLGEQMQVGAIWGVAPYEEDPYSPDPYA
jgi:hypothetical protein